MLNRGGPLSKIVSGTIGLAKEYSADKRQRKEANQAVASDTPVSQPERTSQIESQAQSQRNGVHNDADSLPEEDWILDLDEAQQLQNSTNFESLNPSKDGFDMDLMIQSFAKVHPAPSTTPKELSMDVLLPQRRPKSQHKGFVRAYAPVLQECGIDQKAWFEFLEGLENSINKNSWFHVTNAGILVTGSVSAVTLGISPILHMVSMAIHTSIELSRRSYLNYQQNKYLDIMNEKFFKPRGLYCLVIKYKPSSKEILEEVDFAQNTSRTIKGREEQSKWKNLASGSAMTVQTEPEIPIPAPLVFPDLDSMDEQQKENSIKRFGRVLQDYMDRRAAATFEEANPDTKLPVAPRHEFASVYGDPNSAANSGGFVSLATGGKWNPVGPAGARHDARREHKTARKEKMRQKRAERPMSKVLKSEALYLMVTNMPNQEVMDKVGSELGIGHT